MFNSKLRRHIESLAAWQEFVDQRHKKLEKRVDLLEEKERLRNPVENKVNETDYQGDGRKN